MFMTRLLYTKHLGRKIAQDMGGIIIGRHWKAISECGMEMERGWRTVDREEEMGEGEGALRQ